MTVQHLWNNVLIYTLMYYQMYFSPAMFMRTRDVRIQPCSSYRYPPDPFSPRLFFMVFLSPFDNYSANIVYLTHSHQRRRCISRAPDGKTSFILASFLAMTATIDGLGRCSRVLYGRLDSSSRFRPPSTTTQSFCPDAPIPCGCGTTD